MESQVVSDIRTQYRLGFGGPVLGWGRWVLCLVSGRISVRKLRGDQNWYPRGEGPRPLVSRWRIQTTGVHLLRWELPK